MGWSNVDKAPLVKSNRRDTPDGLWNKCKNCGDVVLKREWEASNWVCLKCQHHCYIPARERLLRFFDSETFQETDADLVSFDPLQFKDKVPYKDRLLASQKKTSIKDAMVSGFGDLMGLRVGCAAFEFSFMGGSMGYVVGEKIARLLKTCAETKTPAVVFSSSGGARMQEGLLSLMQMAKTCAALAMMREEKVPFISVMTHPTTGGVSASYAMLGDINISEPGALIGFAGPRVIEQTIRQSLPEGFQTAEYLLEHGMLDFICQRGEIRPKIAQVLNILCHKN